MKRILLFAITFCLFASSALATPNVLVKNQLIGRGIVDTQADYIAKLLTKSNTFNSGMTIKVRNVADSADVTIATLTSTLITLGAQDEVFQPGQNVRTLPFVATPVATPVQAANYCPPGLCVIPTAAASTAVYVGADPTPVAGGQFTIVSAAGAAVFLKAAGAATMNGTQAGGKISLANLASVNCVYTSATGTGPATNLECQQPVIPTASAP